MNFSSAAPVPQFTGKTILIVDDEVDVADTLSQIMKLHGFEVFICHEGSAALGVCRQAHVDIVVTDIRMPGMSGDEFVKELSRTQGMNEKPILFCMSAYADFTRAEAWDNGADAWFDKPIPFGDLLSAASRFLRMREEAQRNKSTLQQMIALNSSNNRLAEVGMAAASVVHELSNPASLVNSYTEIIDDMLQAEEVDLGAVRSKLSKIKKSTEKIVGLTRALKSHVRGSGNIPTEKGSQSNSPVDAMNQQLLTLSSEPFVRCQLNEILTDSIEAIQPAAFAKGIPVFFSEVECAGITVQVRKSQMCQVLINLLSNALDAVADHKAPWVKVESSICYGEKFTIRVTDSGAGIGEELRSQLFKPFVTSKGSHGTGLGLCIARSIVELHGGKLNIDTSSPNTCFVIELPHP